MGNDDESSNPRLCSEVAGGVTRNIVCLFREPDAGNLPVRFDEREQETGPGQTGLRRAQRKPNPTATGGLQLLRLFSTLLAFALTKVNEFKWPVLACYRVFLDQLESSAYSFGHAIHRCATDHCSRPYFRCLGFGPAEHSEWRSDRRTRHRFRTH